MPLTVFCRPRVSLTIVVGLLLTACSSASTAAPPPTSATSTSAPAVTEPAITEPPTTSTKTPAGCEAVPGITEFSLETAGVAYDVRLFVPSSLDPTGVAPVVLNWHGLGSDGPGQAGFSGYEDLAETEGFLVASPTGPPAAGSDRNTWELSQFDAPGRDDVAFASALIDDLVERFCVDETRVYSTGMSNGGLFTSRLVCDLSERIAAAASVAGLTHPDGCKPSRTVPFIAFHGTADGVVPFDGTTGTSSLLADNAPQVAVDFFSQVMPDEFAEFAADAGCSPDPVSTAISGEVTAHEYQDCGGDTPLIFYEIAGGGHTWPGSPFGPMLEASGFGMTTTDIDATADAWAFFAQHSLEG